ncbi:restriction endonuclease subunit S [Vibrio cholerae]|uniref:restriction endonuclease subunit S n=1 Tax=Vibrio cholerae TaxID=666 RepID=UPI0002C16976|nr:restriction endonuclease subunit S [Vibrio cholerae]ELN3182900.1 restriction endonuclease subunit S [Vibrio cholerae]EMQ64668.1 type I restriction modification DNA specificity domain protein [Vibrio cholerae O1 str. NHCC-008D]
MNIVNQNMRHCYKQSELGEIPKDWEVIKFGDCICAVIDNRGKTPPLVNDGFPLLEVNALFKQGKSPNFEKVTKFVSKSTFESWFRDGHPQKGDILVVTVGSAGETSLVREDGFCIAQNLIGLKTRNTISSDFLYYFTASTPFKKQVEAVLMGAVQPSLKVPHLNKFRVLMPSSREEQIAIANALSDVDALIQELEKLIAKKQAIKTATMQQLLTGRTRLPQFAHHPDGRKKGYKPSELGEIPEDWEVKTYGDVFTFLSTSTNSRADLSNEGEYGYVHYGDIHTQWNNRLDLNTESLPRISKHIVRSAFVMDGDLIMADASEDYAGIGKSVEVFNLGDRQIVAGLHTFLLRDKSKALADGYRGYLHSIPAVKNSFDRLATGMKVYGISKNNLLSVCIPVPSLEEQTAIVTILSAMDLELSVLVQRLDKTRQIKQGMMQELLTGKTRLV